MITPYLSILRSTLKVKILLSLLREEKKLDIIRTEVSSSSSTVLHALRDLEVLNLTLKSEKTYKLTPLGLLEALVVEEVLSAFEVLEKFRDFWLLHDISTIPPRLLMRVGDLREATLVRAEAVGLDQVHKAFLGILHSSRELKGVSPIFHPDYVGTCTTLLSSGVDVELILTGEVIEKVLASPDKGLLMHYFEEGRLRLFQREDLRVGLTVTDSVLSLGLFTLDGRYDYSMDLMCHDPEALEWGNELFRHYLKDSVALTKRQISEVLSKG